MQSLCGYKKNDLGTISKKMPKATSKLYTTKLSYWDPQQASAMCLTKHSHCLFMTYELTVPVRSVILF